MLLAKEESKKTSLKAKLPGRTASVEGAGLSQANAEPCSRSDGKPSVTTPPAVPMATREDKLSSRNLVSLHYLANRQSRSRGKHRQGPSLAAAWADQTDGCPSASRSGRAQTLKLWPEPGRVLATRRVQHGHRKTMLVLQDHSCLSTNTTRPCS